MKDVLVSLKPYFYYLIGEGIKTMEVRKSMPKADDWSRNTWFYMSKDENSFAKIPKELQDKYRKHFGKVGLKFVCDRIDYVRNYGDAVDSYDCIASCLSAREIIEYATDKNGNFVYTYGWHISDLVIYDKPKELGEFATVCDGADAYKCSECEYFNLLEKGISIYKCLCNHLKPLKRPPQSWCYIEDLGV